MSKCGKEECRSALEVVRRFATCHGNDSHLKNKNCLKAV